ncbi:MAG: alpha/beta hydrolase, partial [Prevotellaceae bacterium]|nr:alpha/beta hydrolase [Prevotellaceae bacterium]
MSKTVKTESLNKIICLGNMALLISLMLLFSNCKTDDPLLPNSQEAVDNGEDGNNTGTGTYLTVNDYVRDIVNHPAFDGFGELLLSRDNNSSYHNTSISNVGSLMPYHGNVRPEVVVASVNYMIDEVNSGKTIFYSIYTEEQKQRDPAKRNTGIFFFRGKARVPFAIVCPGGGFSYVGSLHEGFPLAQRISELGLNAFVIRYRIGSERYATEDLAAAITYIFRNAESLGVSTKDYSLWGGSAGARMAG